MNIKEFKEGDVITRNEPMTYKHNGSADSSWCGQKMELLGVDENAKIIFVRFIGGYYATDKEPHQMSYARDPWNEGWTLFPETMYQKAKSLISTRLAAISDKPKNVKGDQS